MPVFQKTRQRVGILPSLVAYLCGLLLLSTSVNALSDRSSTPSTLAKSPAKSDKQVLASIHPLALIAASVVAPEQLTVLLPAHASPHDYALRPSDVQRIQQADIILWNGELIEPYLAKFVTRYPDKVWINVSNVEVEEDDHDHDHPPHAWLAPLYVAQVQQVLAKHLNVGANDFPEQIKQRVEQLQQQLKPYQNRGFYVYHPAYDPWVATFGLKQLGVIKHSPERPPGVKRLQQIRQHLETGAGVCVFREPQYQATLITRLTQGLDVAQGELDPMGRHISVTKQGYADFITDMAHRFVECLAPSTE